MNVIAKNIVLLFAPDNIDQETDAFLDQCCLEQKLKKSGFRDVMRIEKGNKSILYVPLPEIIQAKTYQHRIPEEMLKAEKDLSFSFHINFSQRLEDEYGTRKQICNYNGKIIEPYLVKNGENYYDVRGGYIMVTFNKKGNSTIKKFYLKRSGDKVIYYVDPEYLSAGEKLSPPLMKLKNALDLIR